MKKPPAYLFSKQTNAWEINAQRLHSASGIDLFLDYDGTLTPIKRYPADAVLSSELGNILGQLVKLPDVRVMVVTGRSMEDIRRLVHVENIGFAANHGFHLYHNGNEWIHPQAVSSIQALSQLYIVLQNIFAEFPRVYVENKKFTISIHYRNVAPEAVRSLKSLAVRTLRAYDSTLRITQGKKVIEVRPQVLWGKGEAVLKILRSRNVRQRRLPVFIGDDETDEDVFRALRSKGLMIRVGKSKTTQAQYFIKDVEEVTYLLRSIISLRRIRPSRNFSLKRI